MVQSERHLFDIPRDVCYLNAAYMTPAPLAATEAGITALKTGEHPWAVAPADFFPGSERVRRRFSRILGASADDIALVPSVSYGMATVARNLPISEGQVILVLRDQFPSNIYPWTRLAAEKGARVVALDRAAGASWTDALIAAVDEYQDRVALIACPHYHWANGAPVDVALVGTAARSVGAQFVLDLTQSLGAAPFDLAAADPDYVAVAGYKWLFGPYSFSYLYVAPRHQATGIPLEENWISRKDSEDFARLVDYQQDYQPGARRFDTGERSNFNLTPIADAGLELVESWGIDRIAEGTNARNNAIAKAFLKAGFSPPAQGQRGPHLMGVTIPEDLEIDLAAHFREAGIQVSVRGNSIRIAPHLYVDDADLDHLADCLGRLG